MANQRKHWLLKSEPDVYSIDDLERNGETHWDGVRNYQARNYMRDEMRAGDGVFFYHSGKDKAVMGIARVSHEAYVDPAQFDAASKYYDEKATLDAPRWYMVDIAFEQRLAEPLSLALLKAEPKLKRMTLLQRGQRLSIQPVMAEEWRIVCAMAGL